MEDSRGGGSPPAVSTTGYLVERQGLIIEQGRYRGSGGRLPSFGTVCWHVYSLRKGYDNVSISSPSFPGSPGLVNMLTTMLQSVIVQYGCP